MPRLPVEDVLNELRAVLRKGRAAVLEAPPGAGKTTLVPLALRDEPWLAGQRIIMLEPRRLAARMAATRMASLLDEEVGETVGYRIRLETRVGRKTRIEVVTEGVLTRMLQSDPALDGVGLVIFDEFHERSLHADLGLALALQSQAVLRPDLRLLVMSATIDVRSVAEVLGGAEVISSEGRIFPVETHYLSHKSDERIEKVTATAIRRAAEQHDGDVLVFLPGAGEIARVHAALKEIPASGITDVYPLLGNLSKAEQDLAVAPSPPGRRKVVLATSIAETSLTIEGVHVVVDSGLMRVPRFSPRTGMTSLETLPVTIDAADQRRGRAGRLGPGVCYRLWTRFEHGHLRPSRVPEILEADLVPLALELAAWGVTDANALSWMTPPPEASLRQARELLRYLGALDEADAVTPHGRAMAELGLHPRLAHMVLGGMDIGAAATACDLAALLGERDLFRRDAASADADVRLRLDALWKFRRGERPPPHADRGGLQRASRESDSLQRRSGAPGSPPRPEMAGVLIAFAYPDRIAARRDGERFTLRSGRQVSFRHPQLLSREDYLAVADVGGWRGEHFVYLAAPISQDALDRYFGDQITVEEQVFWDESINAVNARFRRTLGAIVLTEGPLKTVDAERIQAAVLDAVRERGIDFLNWSGGAERLRRRLAFLHRLDDEWPDVSDEALAARLDEWLAPFLAGIRRRDELDRVDLEKALMTLVPWHLHSRLDALAPTHVEVPSGSRIPVDYDDPEAPVLAVRLQEMFGLTETPRIANGRVALTLHLLSPAHRPVQVTQDLASFWRSTYFDVRKDLRGRYPKHHWPEDPLAAEPTSRAKRRR